MKEFYDYMLTQLPEIGSQLIEHIYLTAIAVGIALIIGVPLGIAVYYYKRTSKLILGVANIIQAIPSIALLGFLIPLVGIGAMPAIIGVTLYSLLPIIKNTYIGLESIRPETLEAAKGMGLTKRQVLTKIQIPIALPVIMGGIRIASVTAVGMVTIAAFVGGGGLGTIIFAGIRTVNNNQVLLGAIPACILALVVDWFFGFVEYRLTKRNGAKKRNKKKLVAGLIVVVVIIAGIIGYNQTKKGDDITIGSKDYTEQLIVGNILADLVEAKTDLKVNRKMGLSGSQIVYESLLNNSVDGYVDYLGTVYINILKQKPSSDVKKIYDYVEKTMTEKNIFVGKPLGFNNTYTLSTSQALAKKYNLETISDLAKVADRFSLATSIYFAEQPDGLRGVEDYYGFKFKSVTRVDGGQRFMAMNEGKADFVDAYSTDGLVKKFNLKILKDDKNFFPPYQALTLFKKETLEKHPELKEVLTLMEGLFSDQEMQELNYLVDEKQEKPEKVAHDFLVKKGLITE